MGSMVDEAHVRMSVEGISGIYLCTSEHLIFKSYCNPTLHKLQLVMQKRLQCNRQSSRCSMNPQP